MPTAFTFLPQSLSSVRAFDNTQLATWIKSFGAKISEALCHYNKAPDIPLIVLPLVVPPLIVPPPVVPPPTVTTFVPELCSCAYALAGNTSTFDGLNSPISLPYPGTRLRANAALPSISWSLLWMIAVPVIIVCAASGPSFPLLSLPCFSTKASYYRNFRRCWLFVLFVICLSGCYQVWQLNETLHWYTWLRDSIRYGDARQIAASYSIVLSGLSYCATSTFMALCSLSPSFESFQHRFDTVVLQASTLILSNRTEFLAFATYDRFKLEVRRSVTGFAAVYAMDIVAWMRISVALLVNGLRLVLRKVSVNVFGSSKPGEFPSLSLVSMICIFESIRRTDMHFPLL